MKNRWRLPLVVVLMILFFIVNRGNALHKGGDFESFHESSRRLLNGEPLYAGSSPGVGVTWSPFQSVFFVPFAFVERIHPGPGASVVVPRQFRQPDGWCVLLDSRHFPRAFPCIGRTRRANELRASEYESIAACDYRYWCSGE